MTSTRRSLVWSRSIWCGTSRNGCSLEKGIRHEIVLTGTSGKPTSIAYGGRPMTGRKKQAGALRGTAVTGAQAPREGFTEITLGRAPPREGQEATTSRSTHPDQA